eukprot:557446-Prorocentrum_minimum.AAC.1
MDVSGEEYALDSACIAEGLEKRDDAHRRTTSYGVRRRTCLASRENIPIAGTNRRRGENIPALANAAESSSAEVA